MARLRYEEFVPFAPETEGVVRVNHKSLDCAGDSRSMKITRADTGVIYAKCFRCGKTARYAEGSALYSSYNRVATKRKKVATESMSHEVSLPKDLTSEVKYFPPLIRSKLGQYDINEQDLNRYGIGWSAKYERLFFPVFRDKELKGWQARSYTDNPDAPKYITRYKDDGDLFVYLPCTSRTGIDGCVIVEDFFSGIRCARYTNSLVLLGSNIGDKALDLVTNMHEKFLIFMDHDNRQVVMNELKLKQRLTALGKSVKIISDAGADPKELPPPTLYAYMETLEKL